MSATRMNFVILIVMGTLVMEMSAVLFLASLPLAGRKLFELIQDTKPKVTVTRYVFSEALESLEDIKHEIRFNLAPTYGNLTSKSLQTLDESLRVMMCGILEMHIHNEYSWKELILALDMNMYVRKQSRYSVEKLERLRFSGVQYVGTGSQKTNKMKQIRTWFTNLIGNADILKDTEIDIDSLVKMMSDINSNIFDNLLKNRVRKKTLMDLGILRFPDISKPFFSIYRINLIATCRYKNILLGQVDSSDIIGLFQREVYYPDSKYIKKLGRPFIDQLLSEVDDLFSDL